VLWQRRHSGHSLSSYAWLDYPRRPGGFVAAAAGRES